LGSRFLGIPGRGLKQNTAYILQTAELFTSLLDRHPLFERTTTHETFILTYRFHPPYIHDSIKGPALVNDLLNKVNTYIQEKQWEKGNTFVSRTVLDCEGRGMPMVVFRTILINVFLTSGHLEKILNEQQELGEEFLSGQGLDRKGYMECRMS
jgi:glutamate/tyrosine decarboxylase-like PLP-dependent enzyme